MQLIDSRRLTGPNLFSNAPGAIAEVEWQAGDDPARGLALWRRELLRMLAAIGWLGVEVQARGHRAGASLFLSAPVDALLSATDVNEWAVQSAAAQLAGGEPLELEPARTALLASIAAERQPRLAALVGQAAAHGVPLLIDDDGLTLGAGARLLHVLAGTPLPSTAELSWAELGRIPVALITGTNGKTTTTRLVARIARLAGLRVGNSSSDGVSVQEQPITHGDWSGPDAARLVMRHPEVEIAILEVARGGILRRGLAVSRCDAALITNVTVDHLGSYGVDDLSTMAQVKLVVARNARDVVLNADDDELVRRAGEVHGRLVWFSRTASNPVIAAHRAAGGEAWLVRDDQVIHALGDQERALLAVGEIPLTFGGRAPYNLENALAAAALASALGLPEAAIVAGLREFTSSLADNPGRGNVIEVGGVRVIIDFGHNPAAVRGVMALASALCGPGRLLVVVGSPGDRPDAEILEVAGVIAAARPAAVYLVELEHYLRGRQPREVPALVRAALLQGGLPSATLHDASGEAEGVALALTAARPGDVILAMPHVDDGVYGLLARHAGGPP